MYVCMYIRLPEQPPILCNKSYKSYNLSLRGSVVRNMRDLLLKKKKINTKEKLFYPTVR